MDPQRLYEIIHASTKVFRKAEPVQIIEGHTHDSLHLFGYEHTSRAPTTDNFEKVDMILMDVVVDKTQAEKYRQDLTRLLNDYPEPVRLAGGPSYIELAPNMGIQQEGALRLMALGKTLGFWNVVSAKTLGKSDAEAKSMAESGLLNISGYEINRLRRF